MSRRSGGLAALVAITWGLCFVLIQASLPSAAPLLLAGLRAFIGGAVLAAWLGLRAWRRGIERPRAGASDPRSWLRGLPSIRLLVALALVNAALAFGAMYLAAGRAEAAVASILAGGQPLVLAVAGWALFRERASMRTVMGLAVAMSGVVLVATTSSGDTRPDGVALALVATVAPAAGTVLMRRLGPTVDLLVTTSAQFLLGGVILVGVSAVLEPWESVRWSAAMLSGLLLLGVLGTGLAYVAWFWLLNRVPLWRLGTFLFLVPVAGFLAAIVTGDRPAPVELTGIAGVLAGLGIVAVGGASPRADGTGGSGRVVA